LQDIRVKYENEVKKMQGDKTIITLSPDKTETLYGDRKIAVLNVHGSGVEFIFDNKRYDWGAASNLTYTAEGKICSLALMSFSYLTPPSANFETGCKSQ
jgi:hypothetical protein